MLEDLYVIGIGGHGREVVQIVGAVNAEQPTWHLAGVADDAPTDRNLDLVRRAGVPFVGSLDNLLSRPPGRYLIGIGSGRVREAIDTRLTASGWLPASVVHPSATVGPDFAAEPGLVVFPGARATTNVRVGRHVHLNQNVTVGHDCLFGDFVSVNPLASVSGGVCLGERTTVGTNAAVLQYLTVGADVMVGAGAVVIRDVPAGMTVKGVPAQ